MATRAWEGSHPCQGRAWNILPWQIQQLALLGCKRRDGNGNGSGCLPAAALQPQNSRAAPLRWQASTIQASGRSHPLPPADSSPAFLHLSWQEYVVCVGGLLQITSCLWHKPLPGLKPLNRAIGFCDLTVATPEQWQDCSTTWTKAAGVPKATRKGLRAEAAPQD